MLATQIAGWAGKSVEDLMALGEIGVCPSAGELRSGAPRMGGSPRCGVVVSRSRVTAAGGHQVLSLDGSGYPR